VNGRRPRIVAMGGGGFTAGFQDAALDLFALSLTSRSTPRICLLPTAGGDPEEQIGRFYGFFHGRACDPSHISLFRLGDSGGDLREHLVSQDLIYVGGGSLLNLIAIWRAHELDQILRDAWQAGTVLCGLSAGSMCWFEHGITTSKGPPSTGRGLGFLEGSNSVHWSSQPARRRVFRDAVADGLPAGYGVDDGAALVFKGTRLHEVVATRADARAWRVERDEDSGEVTETAMDVRLLEAPDEGERSGTPAEVLELRAVRRGAELARRHARRVG
jgi:dipeptidase E